MKYELYEIKELKHVIHYNKNEYIEECRALKMIYILQDFIVSNEISKSKEFLDHNYDEIIGEIDNQKKNILLYNNLLSMFYNDCGIINECIGNYKESKEMFVKSFVHHCIYSLYDLCVYIDFNNEYLNFITNTAPYHNINKHKAVFKVNGDNLTKSLIFRAFILQIMCEYEKMDSELLKKTYDAMYFIIFFYFIDDTQRIEFINIFTSIRLKKATKKELQNSISKMLKYLRKNSPHVLALIVNTPIDFVYTEFFLLISGYYEETIKHNDRQ